MRKARKPWWKDGYIRFALGCPVPVPLLLFGYAQSDSRTEWTSCKVDVRPRKLPDEKGNKRPEKRLVCKKDNIMIAIKRENQLPDIPERLLTPNNVLACRYDIVRHKLNIFTEQVDTESLYCMDFSDTG